MGQTGAILALGVYLSAGGCALERGAVLIDQDGGLQAPVDGDTAARDGGVPSEHVYDAANMGDGAPTDENPDGAPTDESPDGAMANEEEPSPGDASSPERPAPPPRSDWTIAASPNPEAESDRALNAIDGDMTTRYTTGRAMRGDEWLKVDFGREAKFNGVRVNYAGSSDDFPRPLVVYAPDGNTDNPEEWGRPLAVVLGSPAGRLRIPFEATVSRYLVVAQAGVASDSWWSVHELDVVYDQETQDGSEPLGDPTDRANWTITAFPAHADTAINAIDGNSSTRYSTRRSMRGQEWLRVDFGGPIAFRGVDLNYAQSAGDYPRTLQVYTPEQPTDDPTKWGAPLATLEGSPSGHMQIPLPATTARHLVIAQTAEASSWWSVHELTLIPLDAPILF